MKLSKEEKEIIEAYDAGSIQFRKISAKERRFIQQTARNTLKKNKRVTLRLYENDFNAIQKKALELGMPYQTLISSLIHRYVEGDVKMEF